MSQDDVSASKQPVNYQVLVPQEYYGNNQGDEVGLFDLFFILWRRKVWVIGFTGLITLASIFFALSMRPVYEAKAYLLPPHGGSIEILNLFSEKRMNKDGVLEPAYTAESVYRQARENLKSRQYRWAFFNQNGLFELYVKESNSDIRPRVVFEQYFSSALDIKDKFGEHVVSFTNMDKQVVAQLLNKYIAFINEMTVKSMLGDVQGTIQLEKRKIVQKIAQSKQDALLQRQDRIEQIKAQIKIARKLNINTNKLANSSSRLADGRDAPPHYLEGTRTLQIKLNTLTSRKSDDPYITELRPLQARLTVLDNAKFDESKIRAFNIDQEALVPEFPIKPRKKLIVILGFIVGGILSVFVVLMWHFFEKYREEHAY